MTRTVEVLLSTYNGERHLEPLLDSVLAQDHDDLRVTVRDDGSTDGTVAMLRGYADDHRLRLSAGPNLGVPGAFFAMLDAADPEAEFVALCDQDDIWLPHKISRAVEVLQERAPEGPALYCARVLVVDELLHPLFPQPLPRRGPSFGNALVQNIATGCTIVVNRAALAQVRRRWPVGVPVHDWWLYLVTAGVGRVVYDPAVTVWYRQHQGNAIGIGRTRLRKAAGRLIRHLRDAGQPSRQARELLRLHGSDLGPEPRRALRRFLECQTTIPGRVRYALSPDAVRQSPADDLLFRLLYAVGRV